MKPLRVAILAHSVNPRGGVVHALELGEALVRLGVHAVVHAPDPENAGFFRDAACETVSVPAARATKNIAELVASRRHEYCRYFRAGPHRDFDVFHAQDSISANALADLKASLDIRRFARTVHHVDHFTDSRLMTLQARGIAAADRHFVVSRQWQKNLNRDFGVRAEIVGNGVDTNRYTPAVTARDAALRTRLQLGAGPVLLAVGGIEERKNTLMILHAFQAIHRQYPAARLIIAGGASLLDHAGYQGQFLEALSAMGLAQAVQIIGTVAQDDMPALYRLADALVFPSRVEGFGLSVLEAMASGTPVLTSRIAPFTEYLEEGDAAWCDPDNLGSIIQGILQVLDQSLRGGFVERGARLAMRHDWQQTAAAHLSAYQAIREPALAGMQHA